MWIFFLLYTSRRTKAIVINIVFLWRGEAETKKARRLAGLYLASLLWGTLELDDILGCRSLGPFDNVELHPFTLFQ